ncbi:MAG: hypothetical protein HQL22_07300 [Candidatus Omnitrophica bacterium]|nr:hypothetical protein [Candidatus Omnitrophota bacterium]
MLSYSTTKAWFKTVAVILITAFLGMIPVQSGYAQVVLSLPAAGEMIHPTAAFQPAAMAGLRVDLKDPFNFYFVMNKGGQELAADDRKAEYQKLIKYFLTSLTTPNQDMWVNLSPNEADRILPANFAKTAMGRDLLAQDYILKQLTASLMYPEDDPGKAFWQKVYRQAYEKFGTTDIPVDSFNKVWIMADKAEIYQKDDTALLVNSHLKVMLDEDYLSSTHAATLNADDPHALVAQVMRDVIVPAIEKEVNEGATFAMVRQVYASMIMATWFKKALKESLLGQVYVNKDKSRGIAVDDPKAREKIYQQYLAAYKTGVYNYIKEEADPLTHESVPRKYFSGGLVPVKDTTNVSREAAQRTLTQKILSHFQVAVVTLLMAAGGSTYAAEVLEKDAAVDSVLSSKSEQFKKLSGISFFLAGVSALFSLEYYRRLKQRERAQQARERRLSQQQERAREKEFEARKVRDAARTGIDIKKEGAVGETLIPAPVNESLEDLLAVKDKKAAWVKRVRASVNGQDPQIVSLLERYDFFGSKVNAYGEHVKQEQEGRKNKARITALNRIVGAYKGHQTRKVNQMAAFLEKARQQKDLEDKIEMAITYLPPKQLRAIIQKSSGLPILSGDDKVTLKKEGLQAAALELTRQPMADLIAIVEKIRVKLAKEKGASPIIRQLNLRQFDIALEVLRHPGQSVDWLVYRSDSRMVAERAFKVMTPDGMKELVKGSSVPDIIRACAFNGKGYENLKALVLFTKIDRRLQIVLGEEIQRDLNHGTALLLNEPVDAGDLNVKLGILKESFVGVQEQSQALKVNNSSSRSSVGGIDLNEDHLTLLIKVDGNGLPLPAARQDPAMMNIEGLSPMIRAMEPLSAANVPVLSELMK